MDIDKLNREIERILSSDLSSREYSDIKRELTELGYDQAEQLYILREIDEKGLMVSATATAHPGRGKIILGGILCVISLLVVGSLYLGPATAREVYYVSLALFAIGYFILRSGIRTRNESSKEEEN